jgi:hypothetical protein
LFLLCLGLPSGIFPPGFPAQTLYALLFLIHVTCPTHLILHYFVTQIIFGKQCKSWNSSLCSLLQSLVTLSRLGPNIFHSTLFSNTHSLYSMQSVRDQISHSYKTAGKDICVWFNLYIFLVANRKTKKILDQMVAGISWVHSALNLFMNAIVIC